MSLALILGQGRLPHILAGACPEAPRLSLEGFAPDGIVVEPMRIETLVSHLAELRARGVDRVCLAGAMRRPAIDPARVDAATAPLVPRLVARMGQGDGALLHEVLAIFDEAGLVPVAAQDIVPDLLPPGGVMGRVAPDKAARRDAARAAEVLETLGPADLGQGCVVVGGLVLAVETLPGTDFMLRTVALARREGFTAPGGILMKAPKPRQDRRVDWPAIGPETVTNAAAAGLGGIVVAKGGVLVLDRAATVAAADAAGIFLWVRG